MSIHCGRRRDSGLLQPLPAHHSTLVDGPGFITTKLKSRQIWPGSPQSGSSTNIWANGDPTPAAWSTQAPFPSAAARRNSGQFATCLPLRRINDQTG
jgi:hypothetical protein